MCILNTLLYVSRIRFMTWDSVVGYSNLLCLDGLGIESSRDEIFAPIQTGPRAYPASCAVGTRSHPQGVKQPGYGVNHSPPI